MKRLAKILALFLLVVILIGFYRSTQNSQAAGPSGAGVNIDPTFAPARPSAEQLLAAGVKNVRMVYKSDTFDYLSYISELKRAGIETVMVLNQETLWPPSGDGNFDQQYIHDFSEKARTLAILFGSNVKAYEIWNEEDASSQNSIYVPPQNYAALLAATYNAIHGKAPVLVGGLVAGGPGYLDAVKAAAGGRIPADGIGVHPYIIDINALVASVKSYLKFGLPIWITEFGWENDQPTEDGLSVQGDYLCAVYTKMQLDSQLYNNVEVVQWYDWTDESNKPGFPFGLLDRSGQPKPVFDAFRKCASQFETKLSESDLQKIFRQVTADIQPIIAVTPNTSTPGVSHPPDYDPITDNDTSPPTFRPLGSLESCPPEIPINGKITDPTTLTKVVGTACGVEPKAEPAPCSDPSLVGKSKEWNESDWCETYAGWCYPETVAKSGGFDCSHGNNDNYLQNYSKNVNGFCLGTRSNGKSDPIYQSWAAFQKVCIPGSGGGSDLNADNQWKVDSIGKGDIVDKEAMQYCLGYYLTHSTNTNQPLIEQLNGLPTCVPTNDKTKSNRCVSECSVPINVEENLKISGNCLSGECKARITIDQNKFFLPFAAELANYFTGVLDSEHVSDDQLDRLQLALRSGTNVQEVFDKAGPFRKLMPQEIQDKLKCDFVSYVIDKKKSGGNTKYLDRSDASNIKEFKIFDKNITEVKCPPTEELLRSDPNIYRAAYDNWQKAWGKYWFAVPLFANDEALGKIEFVSPSVFSNNADSPTLKDANGDPVKVGPVYVSLPEIQRLNSVTSFLQQAFIPKAQVDLPDSPETIGRAFSPTTPSSNACTSGWNVAYDSSAATDTLGKNNGLSQFNRGVNCKIPSLPGEKDSEVCTVDPNGQLRCGTVNADVPPSNYQPGNYSETVQVRTIFPHLYDIAEQTISPVRGLLRIFKPTVDDMFEKKFEPIPASINDVHYKIESENDTLRLQDKPEGWQVFFYKLGGLVTARNFILELLNPNTEPAGTGYTPVQTPQ